MKNKYADKESCLQDSPPAAERLRCKSFLNTIYFVSIIKLDSRKISTVFLKLELPHFTVQPVNDFEI